MATGTLNFKPEAQSDRTICTLPGPGGPAGPNSPPPRLPTEELSFLLVLGPVDLAAGKAPIENVERCGPSFADGRPIRHPDNNSG